MIAFPSVLNLELEFHFGDVLSVSSSRTRLSVPRNFNLKYGSWTSASFKSKVVPPTLVTTAAAAITTTEEKVVLHKFLREQGYSSTLARATVKKSDRFIEHLVARLSSLKSSGHELTATEIRDASTHEPLCEQYGVPNVADNFIDPTVEEVNSVSPTSPSSTLLARDKLLAVSMVDKWDLDGNLSPLVLYLLDLGFDLVKIKEMIWRYPSLITFRSLRGKIKPLVEFLLALGVPKSDIPIIFHTWGPRLCECSVEKDLLPNVALFESLGVVKRRWPIVLRRGANILCLSRQNIEATVNFLLEMGVPPEKIGKIIERCPTLMASSVEDKLRPVCEYFRSFWVDVAKLLQIYPHVFNLSIESKLKHVTRFFLDNGFSEEEIGFMTTRFGCFYGYSLATILVPKWEYFLTMDYPRDDLIRYPWYFSFSLEKRIKPRHALVKWYGVQMGFASLLSSSDLEFDNSLKKKTGLRQILKLSERK